LLVEPACRHFGTCGGCDLQDRAYADQLILKRDRLVELLEGLVPADRVRPCLGAEVPGAPWGLRRKVHFLFVQTHKGLQLAHHARGGRRPVVVAECPVHSPEGNRLAEALRAALDDAGVKAVPQGPVRHVVVRDLRTSPAIVTLVVDRDGDPRVRRAVGKFIDGEHRRASVYLNVNDEDSPYIFGRETRHLAGPRRSSERVGGIDFTISATSFFQTNVDAAELLASLVVEPRDRPHRGARAVDLYAGVGLFALGLAKAGYQVLAVEENPAAIADGIASMRENQLSSARCRFVRSPVRKVDVWSRQLPPGPIDRLVLDPPRSGVGPQLLREVLAKLGPERVTYVSCDPESLAQDLTALTPTGRTRGSGYEVLSVQPVDMFPQTTHIEAVIEIRRQATSRPSRPPSRAGQTSSHRRRP
jgi:23S rRNA (uracil1939-C5)-methyltransferase